MKRRHRNPKVGEVDFVETIKTGRGRKHGVTSVMYENPNGWKRRVDEDGNEFESTNGYAFERFYVSPLMGGDYWLFGAVVFQRPVGGSDLEPGVTSVQGYEKFYPYSSVHAPRFYVGDSEPRIEDEQLRAMGTHDYLMLRELWPHFVMATRARRRGSR